MPADTDLLLERLYHGELSPVEDAALAQRLRDDPALLTRALEEDAFACLLRDARHADDALADAVRSRLPRRPSRHLAAVVGARLRERSQRRRLRWRIVAGTLAGLAAAIALFVLWPVPGQAPIVVDPSGLRLVAGQARITGDGRTMTAGAAFSPGEALEVIAEASLDLGGRHRCVLPAGSLVTVAAPSPGVVRLDLERGSTHVEAAPMRSGEALSVETRDGTATVVGTAFSVTLGGRTTEVVVEHGTVTCRSDTGASLAVGPGQRAVLLAGAAPEVAGRESVTLHDFTTGSSSDGVTTLPYRLFTPAGGGNLPLIVYLHGNTGEGTDNRRQITADPAFLALLDAANRRDHPCLLLAPQSASGYWREPEQAALARLVSELCLSSPIDPDRVYLTGTRWGGAGAFYAAVLAPDRYAALVPVEGWPITGSAAKVARIPTWAFQGQGRDMPGADTVDRFIATVRQAGGTARVSVCPAAGADLSRLAYRDPGLLPWMMAQRRRGGPSR